MLSEEVKSKIEKVDVLTDYDGTMVKEQGMYNLVFAYFLSLSGLNRINFVKNAVLTYKDYRKNNDVRPFYSLLKDCPVKVIDKVVEKYSPNWVWNGCVGNLKMGIVSRNNHEIISEYLKIKKDPSEVEIVAANKPKIENGVYTGEVELIVNNGNLVKFVEKKDYLCGKEERKILESYFKINFRKEGEGLYLCSKKKIF
ncbi:hypothetical protein KAJ87_04165 [Candidatus Pacearchaeota archaeon]|nr:hypothetical protein [Candidatus Pacearchaeota archaeon]